MIQSEGPSLGKKKYLQRIITNLKNKQKLTNGLVNITSESKIFNLNFFKALESQLGLLVIVAFSLIMNLSIASAKNINETTNSASLSGLTPEAITDTITTINQYTPGIVVDNEKVQYAMAMQSDSDFMITSDEFNTHITPPDPVAPEPIKPRTGTVNYTVASGDTVSNIAQKFGLTIASIQYNNSIANSDSLKIDQVLKIPSANLSKLAIAKAAGSLKPNTLAYGNRSTVVRDSSNEGGGSFIVPIAHHGISRGLRSYHSGIDYMAYVGTSVRASAGGTVIEARSFGWNYGWGKTILISHGNGITTRYAHLSQMNVSVGEHVGQGEVIGKSGNTGNSTGPHLHFQKEINGRPVYPF
ncbi:MAG: peptidoglycan DD-metalloendopeptidase family protein [bacterium]|nr:peptidoglycan DD-metalloendopeptidase family protein [bacterium]